MARTKIMFVCLGNICRSPMAEGSFRQLVKDEDVEHLVEIASAGTGAWHVGNPPDDRAMATALARGIDISTQRAQKVKPADFDYFDYLLAMDQENFDNLMRMAPADHRHKVKLFLDFAPDQPEREVPDPYYGGAQGFEHVFDLVQAASRGLLEEIRG